MSFWCFQVVVAVVTIAYCHLSKERKAKKFEQTLFGQKLKPGLAHDKDAPALTAPRQICPRTRTCACARARERADSRGAAGVSAPRLGCLAHPLAWAEDAVAIFCPFGQFCEIGISLLSL